MHQQLDTSHKLFCSCRSELSTLEPGINFYRRLRPTQSELGEVDPAAAFEFKRGRGFRYEADDVTSCLVELDEEPPHGLNMEAVDTCLTIALMLNSRPVDEIHVMRKIVIDGSNTTGFQRTCIVALGGEITVNGKKIPIQTICLEEDAARKTGEKGLTTYYRLDRLCIPLVELATAPAIYSPEEAGEVALALGRVLRATGRVKHGLGTIRQDLNISIRGGGLIEVKGVQELELVPKVIEYEVQRQLSLIKVRDELVKRGVKKKEIKNDFLDVTEVFGKTKCKIIIDAIKKDTGGIVLAVNLPKFGGLLKTELEPGIRLGTEIADYAKFWGKVGGIFHTDELPGFGITENEVGRLIDVVKAGDIDTVVIVADRPEKARDALDAVVLRARMAVTGVQSETRGAYPDGTTHYSRPRPGAARMYPETDIPPVPITEERLSKIRLHLPEMPDKKISRLMSEYKINRKLAKQLMNSDYINFFERMAKELKISATFMAAMLTETLKSLRREGVNIENLTERQIEETFKLVDKGVTAKEAVPDIWVWLA
ncbi:MAG: Glu-tRNA(Gln) amidotransferase subunit GatE, partial [Candidatus Bathyarchaeota archaeon]|nr:Glu-tRNA(Gln) amidotransferase subunit GatE [Candidatus Bathyarchaeota archaeon]